MAANTWFIISIVGYSLAVVLLIVAIILFYKMNILAIIGDLSGKTAARQIQEIREQNAKSGQKRYKPNAFNVQRGSLTEPVSSVSSQSSRLGNKGETGQTVASVSKRLFGRGETGQTVAPVSKRLFGRGDIGQPVASVSKPLNGGGQTVEASDSVKIESKPTVVLEQQENLSIRDEQTVVLFSQDTEVLEGNLKYEAEVSAATEVFIQDAEVLNDGTELLALSDGTEVLAKNDGTELLAPSDETVLLSQTEATKVLSDDAGTTVLYPTSELEQENSENLQAIEFKIVKDIKVTHTSEKI